MRLCIFGLDEFSIDSPEDFIRLVLMSDLFLSEKENLSKVDPVSVAPSVTS